MRMPDRETWQNNFIEHTPQNLVDSKVSFYKHTSRLNGQLIGNWSRLYSILVCQGTPTHTSICFACWYCPIGDTISEAEPFLNNSIDKERQRELEERKSWINICPWPRGEKIKINMICTAFERRSKSRQDATKKKLTVFYLYAKTFWSIRIMGFVQYFKNPITPIIPVVSVAVVV